MLEGLSEVFDHFLGEPTILTNREVLRPDYVPENLPHRDEQIRRLGWIVAPVLKGSRCSNVFIYGKPGTGKTAVVRYVLAHLLRKSDELHTPVEACYVNCRIAGTDYRVLSVLSESVGVRIPFTGLSTSEVFDRFRVGLASLRGVLTIVLDEVDVLVKQHGDDLLYELTRVNETSEIGKLVFIGISNDLNFKDLLDPRVLSSLSEEELVFRPYVADELYDILAERAKLSFIDGALEESALRLCAALAAAEHGDARRALDLLRVSAELAEREGAKLVTESHVRQAQRKIEENRVNEALKTLPLHQRLVLYSIYHTSRANMKDCLTGDIYEIYADLCGKTGLEPLTQRRISGLINELDVLGIVNAKLVSRGRHGRSKRVRLNMPLIAAQEHFKSDPRFGPLLSYVPRHLRKTP
ncbi:MAG: orc1/cdc6 family replication initiation protein [Candidatus Bathyarchaeia archaeon]